MELALEMVIKKDVYAVFGCKMKMTGNCLSRRPELLTFFQTPHHSTINTKAESRLLTISLHTLSGEK